MAPQFQFATSKVNDVSIHHASLGEPAAPLILCLHGFPEYWGAWADVMPFLAERFRVVAPDQRGFNLSSKPQGVEAYHARLLVKDMFALADELAPRQKIIVAGHDWGSAVAYAMAFAKPERISHLIVANGVHPWCFQRAIVEDPDQRQASQYMTRLRDHDSAELMSADNFAKTLGMFERFSAAEWLTAEKRAAYLEAWGQPGAMDSMLNWYRSSPVVVPPVGAQNADAPLLSIDPQALTVRVPHLVLWGEGDQALRPSCLYGLDRFAPDFTVKRRADATHWILHEQPQWVAREMRAFLEGPA